MRSFPVYIAQVITKVYVELALLSVERSATTGTVIHTEGPALCCTSKRADICCHTKGKEARKKDIIINIYRESRKHQISDIFT